MKGGEIDFIGKGFYSLIYTAALVKADQNTAAVLFNGESKGNGVLILIV